MKSKSRQRLKKLQDVLKAAFQLDASRLEFGFYRILNYKRNLIEKFLNEDLEKEVEKALSKHVRGRGGVRDLEELKKQVFTYLYDFFSKFYVNGCFTPQFCLLVKSCGGTTPFGDDRIRPFLASKGWYYVKTGTSFRDYGFKVGDLKVKFAVVKAKEELSSNKATKERFFVLDEKQVEKLENELVVRFHYRELTKEEVKFYDVESGSTASKQKRINQKSYEIVLSKVNDDPALKDLLSKKNKKDEPLFLSQLNRFTTKSVKDYFIHKNLKEFLLEHLDYFIKSKLLDLDALEEENSWDERLAYARVVREVGRAIVDLLSQVEDLQRRAWERKKFVVRTEYVITLDKVKELGGDEFVEEVLREVLQNEKQLKEWEELGFGKVRSRCDLLEKENFFERSYKKLPVDTKHFSQEFKEKLLEKLTEKEDLDDLLDGVLIKSENWQALNLLLNKYRGKVQTIYIDPPFNKEQDADYLYNVKYDDFTWACMLENRLRLAREFLKETGSIFVRCDYNGNWIVRPLMDALFGKENFRNEIIVRRGAPKAGLFFQFKNLKSIGVVYDNLYWYSKNEKKVYARFTKSADKKCGYWTSFKKIYDRPTMRYELLGVTLNKGQWMWSKERAEKAVQNYLEYLKVSQETGETLEAYSKRTGITEFVRKHKDSIQYWVRPRDEDLCDNNWLDVPGYSSTWKLKEEDDSKRSSKKASFTRRFKTENSEHLLKRVITSTSQEKDVVMDFFLGSGTTVAVAHKLKRKWIGVEVGEHFWSVVLPRAKKVLFYDETGVSKEKDVKEKYDVKTAGGFFKYQVLEQYEDALDNVELDDVELQEGQVPELFKVKQLKDPFNYELKVNPVEVGEPTKVTVDVPETFTYLLGLKVKKVKVRLNERKYLFVLGEKEGKKVAIVWRQRDENWSEEDRKKDEDFIRLELQGDWNPRVLYVNGNPPLALENCEVKCVEAEFEKLLAW